MGTLFDYLAWRGDLGFDQAPLNEVDSLIFSLLSYIEYKNIVSETHRGEPVSLQAAANAFFARNPDPKKISMGLIVPKDILKLFKMAKECRRFRGVGLKAYVNRIDLELQMQFSAVTYCLETGEQVITYRGTDDTLVGWKENFNMSFMDEIPAQKHAKEYLVEAAASTKAELYVTGHSKGGNLAVYSAIHAPIEVKNRLITVWCNDGPGFRNAWLHDPKYLDIKAKIKTLLPQSSIVGILLEHEESYSVVKSSQKGLWQHDGLTWAVVGSKFQRVKDVSEDSKRVDKTLKKWIEGLSLDQREQFCEALYKVLSADNAMTLTDLVSLKNKWIARGKSLDPEVHKVLRTTLKALLEASASIKSGKALDGADASAMKKGS